MIGDPVKTLFSCGSDLTTTNVSPSVRYNYVIDYRIDYRIEYHVVSCRNQATKILGLYLPDKHHVRVKISVSNFQLNEKVY